MEPEAIVGVPLSDLHLQADVARHGWTPHTLELAVNLSLHFVYDALPDPLVSVEAPQAAAADGAWVPDGVDRVSRLPDGVLRNVISRLPARDAARTSVLASRWRGLWLSVPLALVDAHFLPDGDGDGQPESGSDSPAVAAAVSGALAAHPGPFRCVHLIYSTVAGARRGEIPRWLQLLAIKGVRELVLINRPWPLDVPLPTVLFSCGASLASLHIGVWRFPDTAALPRGACFPHLRELGLYVVVMQDRDLAFLLGKCPVLERLLIMGCQTGVRFRLVSHSLRSVQISFSYLEDIVVLDAPRLERFLLYTTFGLGTKSSRLRVKICHAPMLRLLGYLQLGDYGMEIGDTIIKAATKAIPSRVVPSVQILALEVKFGVRNYVKMLPALLKCFPNIETLHFHVHFVVLHWSEDADENESTGKVPVTMWQEAGTIECVQQRLKKVVFCEFRGSRNELLCLKFIAERARMLEEMAIVVAYECHCHSSAGDVNAKLKPLLSAKWASKECDISLWKSPRDEGGLPVYSVRLASDLSVADPFDLIYYNEML